MVRLKLSDPPQAKPLPIQEQSAERPRNPTGVYAGKRFHCMCSCSNAARLVVRIPTADTCSVYRPGPDPSATVLWARASRCRARTALWDRSTRWVQKAHHARGHRPSTTTRPRVGCYQMEMPRRPMSLCIWVPTETGSSVAEEPDDDDAASHTYQMQLAVALALSDPLIMGHGRAG
jgi:hypothetical protein